MRRILALAMLALFAAFSACRKEPEGTLKVLVVGQAPKMHDPSSGLLSSPDQLLLLNVAQGLVRFDSSGNIVSGLAERWTVTDDGLSYIFRLASTNWPDGRRITAEQVARVLKREISGRSKNSLKDSFGAVDNIVAMTDRVIEISLTSPRPELLSLLAQPQMAIVHNAEGTGPFRVAAMRNGEIRLTREIVSADEETTSREELILGGAAAPAAIRAFAAGKADLVLGGTFTDLAYAQRISLPGGSLRFDPASGIFGLAPVVAGGPLDKPQVRQLLSQAIDRESFVTALGVPGLAPRATLLEPGLDGIPVPPAPQWLGRRYAGRFADLRQETDRLFGKSSRPVIRVALPSGPGADLLFQFLSRDWGQLGFTLERTQNGNAADFMLIDEVAPSTSPAWFVRRFRCTAVAVCDAQADELMDGARQSPVPAQRYALLSEAAARLDADELLLPIAAPVRWSLVSPRIQNFAGNRYARHTLTELEIRPINGE